MRWCPAVISLLAASAAGAGCKKAPPRFDGPLRVTFGDCAPATTTWVSGPRPVPFTRSQAAGIWVASPAPPPADDPPPPPPSPDEGRAMELDEGTATQEAVAQAARQQAIDQARAAGILGAVAGGHHGGGGGGGWRVLGDNGPYGAIGGGGTIGGGGIAGGGGSDRWQHASSVALGQPSADGDLDKAIIRRYIRRNIQKITYCYEKQLLAKPGLAGTLSVTFFITPTGSVERASAAGVDPEVASCVVGVIRTIEFPKPKGGGGVQVNYPFTFRAAGSAAPAPAPEPTPAPAPTPEPTPAPPGLPPPDASNTTHTTSIGHPLFRPSDTISASADAYQPGAASPLVYVGNGLTECFRRAPTHAGAAVITLTYDASGSAASVTADGLADPATHDCVLEAAKSVERASAGTPPQRCSIAFGDEPESSLPSLELAPGSIRLAGSAIDLPPEATGDGAATLIPALVTAEAARIKLATPAGNVLSRFGPLVVRPLDATPMRLVNLALASIVAAGGDFVLASQHGADWHLLAPMPLPVVPVPVGTGATWNPLKTHGPWDDDDQVVLSLYVTKDKLWVGVSRINEFTAVERDASADDKLLAALKERKASALFADRHDFEIAGDGDVTYRDVLDALAIARDAGFTDWQITTPTDLAAYPAL